MWDRWRDTWLPRTCFAMTLAVAVALATAVCIAPWLSPDPSSPRLLVLFAEDVTVRRTALASAAGLVVTAFVFFRPTGPRPRGPAPPAPGREGRVSEVDP